MLELKRFKELEKEKNGLRKIYADMALGNLAVKDLLGRILRPSDRRWTA